MERKKAFLGWVKEHKTEIIVAGASAAAIAGAVLIAKNWDALKNVSVEKILSGKTGMKENAVIPTTAQVSEFIENTVTRTVTNGKIIDVSEHLRILPEGWHASAGKVATAAEHGYDLASNQTWIIHYTKNCA